MPELGLKIMMNVGNPDRAFDFAGLPNDGVGLARLEFIINRMIGVHPRALLEYEDQTDALKAEIDEMMAGYASPVEYYIGKLTEAMAANGFSERQAELICYRNAENFFYRYWGDSV